MNRDHKSCTLNGPISTLNQVPWTTDTKQLEQPRTTQESNQPWIGIYLPEWINPTKGQKEIENFNQGSTPIEGHFTPIWQNWSKTG